MGLSLIACRPPRGARGPPAKIPAAFDSLNGSRMNVIKTFLLFRKFGPFLRKRAFPVLLIWASVVLVYWTLTSGLGVFLEGCGREELTLTSLMSFADGRVVAVLFFGVMAIMGLFTMMLLNLNHGARDRNRMTLFFYDLLDEVSSAATHVGAALAAAIVHQAVLERSVFHWGVVEKGNAATAFAYIFLGLLAFRHAETEGNEEKKAKENEEDDSALE